MATEKEPIETSSPSVKGGVAPFTPDSAAATGIHPSPNHGERAAGKKIEALILHYTGMSSGEDALQRLCDPAAEVSSHYFVWEDGQVLQLVPEARRAWHAGKSYWAGETDINSVSIGIEIVNPGHDGGAPPFPQVQIDALIALCRDIAARHAIVPQNVLGHSDVAPHRKSDPGELFPWDQLAAAGIGHYVPPVEANEGENLKIGMASFAVEGLQAMLGIYGYDAAVTGLYGKKTANVVRAFQRHFRPSCVDGVADPATVETLRARLATRPQIAYVPAHRAVGEPVFTKWPKR